MSRRQIELALRKQRLLRLSAEQRQHLAAHALGLRPLFAGADRVAEAVSWVRRHPGAVAASGAAFFLLRPRLLWRVAMRGLSAWRLLKTLRNLA